MIKPSVNSKKLSVEPKQVFGMAQGFTVVELLAVVVLVSLMATAAGGLYLNTFKKMQLEKSANELMLSAKYARLAAVEKQKECRLLIDKENGQFLVSVTETDKESGEDVEAVVTNPYSKPGQLAESVFFEDVKIVRSVPLGSEEEYDLENVIIFTPYGSADRALIKISNGRNSYIVSISAATGKAKISEGDKEKDESMTPDIVDLDAYN